MSDSWNEGRSDPRSEKIAEISTPKVYDYTRPGTPPVPAPDARPKRTPADGAAPPDLRTPPVFDHTRRKR